MNGLKIVDCYGRDVYLGGYFERLVVNDVDVTAYVEAELDRRQPARALARDAASPEDYRAARDAIENLWSATIERARLLPSAKLHEQVDGEWSFVETQRHLLFACDAWLGNAVVEEEAPFHSLGLPAGEGHRTNRRSSASSAKPPRHSTKCSCHGSPAWPRCAVSWTS
ncbi:DinB family protein [Amycolatopsis sp. NPDC004625]|uniref:DinB family protein n=1 Tax=Amycolatopsis sp. NPDC004625 TaxID=3154670 RepID=UPI0033ABD367